MRTVALLLFGALVSLTAVSAARAQRGSITSIGGYDILLQNESVLKEIKLNEEQTTKVKETIHGVRRKYRGQLDALRSQGLGSLSDKARSIMDKISEETFVGLADVLDASQLKRLRQIKLQQDGLKGMLEGDIAKALKLTDAQRAKIRSIQDDLHTEIRDAVQSTRPTDLQAGLKRIGTLRKKALDQALTVLDAGQKKLWEEAAGEPFSLRFENSSSKGSKNQGKEP